MSPLLVLGLGESGCRVVAELGTLRASHPQLLAATELLALDEEPAGASGSELRFTERLTLDGQGARDLLRLAESSDPRFAWLGEGQGRHFVDEIQTKSAGNERWLGRLAVAGSAASLAQRIRNSGERARDRAGDGTSLTVVVVASAAGGTGSGGWLDLSFLALLLLQPTRLIAALLLPAEGPLKTSQAANTYACLREANHLKYGQLGFEALWDDQLRIRCPAGGGEVWQRLYLLRPRFATEEGFQECLRQTAYVVLAQTFPGLSTEIACETKDKPRLISNG